MDNIHTKLNRIEQQQLEQDSKNLMQELYDKRLNLLIHGLEENIKTDWETHESCRHVWSSGQSAGLVINTVSVQNPLAPLCCVLGKDTLRHILLLGGPGKQF